MPIRNQIAPRLGQLAAALATLLVVAGCSKKDSTGQAKPAQAVPVDAGIVRVGSVQRSVSVVGTLFGEEDATISNKVPGKVIAIYKDVGDRADPGEPLAQLLRNDYLLSVNQKRSALLESLAKLGVEDVPADNFDIGTLPAVRRAKLQAENSENKFNRGQKLHEQKLVSDQDFEDLQTAWSVAKSNFDVEAATAKGLIGEARTRLADLRVAEQALADSTVRAPYEKYEAPNLDSSTRPTHTGEVDMAGPATRPTTNKTGRYVIAGRLASVGELFPAVTPMFRLVDDDPLKLKAAVPERYFQELAMGQKVRVHIDAYANDFYGEVTRINPQVDTANRTFPVEVQVPNSEHRLPPGAFARATIDTHMANQIVFVPAQAVVSFAGNDKVFLIKEGKAREVQVKLGDRLGDEVEVIEGLKGGETIAVTGTSRLATGVAVQVKPATQATLQPATQPTTVPSSVRP